VALSKRAQEFIAFLIEVSPVIGTGFIGNLWLSALPVADPTDRPPPCRTEKQTILSLRIGKDCPEGARFDIAVVKSDSD